MNLIDYRIGAHLVMADLPFHSLLSALLLKADPGNFKALERAFPEQVQALRERMHSPNGVIEGDIMEGEGVSTEEYLDRLQLIVNEYLARLK